MLAPVIIGIVTAVLALSAGAVLGARWARRRLAPNRPLREAATGLPDRAAALEHLQRTLSLAERRGFAVTVMVIVLDGAAQRSHADLGRIERDLARRLAPRLRAHELLTHWGPGQFLIVLPDAEVSNALVLAEDLRQLAAAPASASGDLSTSVSIGLHSRAPRVGQDLRALAVEMVTAAQRSLEVTGANGPGRIEIEP